MEVLMHDPSARVASAGQMKGDASTVATRRACVLLLNPPVYDVRLPWAKFQQPTQLLRLATALRRNGADVRLIDALYCPAEARLPRRRVAILDTDDGLTINKWRFGMPSAALSGALRSLNDQGWRPDTIYVESFATHWWEGAAEIIAAARACFPNAQVILTGAYAALAPAHAAEFTGADDLRAEPLPGLTNLPPDVSLYPSPPAFVWLSLGDGSRPAATIIDEIASLATAGVRAFAFADERIATRFPSLYRAVLDGLIDRRLRIALHAFGTLAPQELVEQPDLAVLLHRAGYAQLNLADDRAMPLGRDADDAWLAASEAAAMACTRAGFRPRSGEVTGGLCLGRGGENLAERARLATLLSQCLGSIIFWPYQPDPDECADGPLEARNGKLYPLRARNGATYQDYLGVLGLATVLNAKYRSRTFDFLGDGLVATLLRDSLGRRAWDPDPVVKGSLRLPVLQR